MAGYPKVEAQLVGMIDRWLDQLERDGLDRGIAVNPLGPRPARLTSDFAEREAPVAGASSYHPAYDLKLQLKKGAPEPKGPVRVSAAVSGMVLFDGWYTGKSGRVVIVGGDNGRIQVYGHLDEKSPKLAAGTRLVRGEALGIMGHTGKVSATCLHYVERQLGIATDRAGHAVYDAVHDADDQPIIDARTNRAKALLRRTEAGLEWDNLRYHEANGAVIAQFRAGLNGGTPLRFDDFVPVAPTIGWNDQPLREGSIIEASNDEQLRHARRYHLDRGGSPTRQKKAAAPALAEGKPAAQTSVWDMAKQAACQVTGGWLPHCEPPTAPYKVSMAVPPPRGRARD